MSIKTDYILAIFFIATIIALALAMIYLNWKNIQDLNANSKYCEAYCREIMLEYVDLTRGIIDGYNCVCKKCETREILDKKVGTCETFKFNLEIE